MIAEPIGQEEFDRMLPEDDVVPHPAEVHQIGGTQLAVQWIGRKTDERVFGHVTLMKLDDSSAETMGQLFPRPDEDERVTIIVRMLTDMPEGFWPTLDAATDGVFEWQPMVTEEDLRVRETGKKMMAIPLRQEQLGPVRLETVMDEDDFAHVANGYAFLDTEDPKRYIRLLGEEGKPSETWAGEDWKYVYFFRRRANLVLGRAFLVAHGVEFAEAIDQRDYERGLVTNYLTARAQQHHEQKDVEQELKIWREAHGGDELAQMFMAPAAGEELHIDETQLASLAEGGPVTA